MAVQLHVTDTSDGSFCILHVLFPIPLHNQVVAFEVSASLLRHVSCDVPCEENMSTAMLTAILDMSVKGDRQRNSSKKNHGSAEQVEGQRYYRREEWQMKKTLLVGMAILLLTISALSGCILVPVDDGYRGGNSQGRGHGDHHGQQNDRQGDRDDRH